MSDDAKRNRRFLITASEAAKLLNVSEKTLWNHTSPRGSIPVIRLGRTVRYERQSLQAWIAAQLAQQIPRNGQQLKLAATDVDSTSPLLR